MVKGEHWVTGPADERPVKIGSEGISASPARTVPELFKRSVERFADAVNNILLFSIFFCFCFFYLMCIVVIEL